MHNLRPEKMAEQIMKKEGRRGQLSGLRSMIQLNRPSQVDKGARYSSATAGT